MNSESLPVEDRYTVLVIGSWVSSAVVLAAEPAVPTCVTAAVTSSTV